jgi:TonB family protein
MLRSKQSSFLTAIALVSISCFLQLPIHAQTPSAPTSRSEKELLMDMKEWHEPVFPPIARHANAGGAVVVELIIDEEGNVSSARIVSGHPLLQAALLQAARSWKFNPVLIEGRAVSVKGRMTYTFPISKAPSKDESIRELARKVRRNPKSAEAHYDLGRGHFEASNYSDAIKEFSAAIRINPKHLRSHLNLGHAYARLDDFDKAQAAYTEAIKVDPNSSEALHALGLVYMGQQKYHDAIVAFDKSLRVEDPITSTYFFLGKCHFLLHRSREAVEFYKQGLAKHPESDSGHYGLGEAYLDLEQYSAAITEFKEALRLSNGQGVSLTRYHLGLAYLRSGDRDSAMREYEILKIRNAELAERLLREIKLVKPREIGD